MASNASRTESGPTEVQFLKRIRSSTFHRIKFPAEFYKTYVEGKHIDEFITLKSPRLCRPWKVTRVGDSLTDGWSGFVKLHNLNSGDYVHFSHEGDFVFYVTTFSEDGDRILYGKNQTSPASTRTGQKNQARNEGSRLVQKKTTDLGMNEAAVNSSRAKGKAAVVTKDAGTTLGQKRKSVHDKQEAGNSGTSKGNEGVVIKGAGSSPFPAKKTKKDSTTQPAENDCVFLSVTQRNVDRNSLYIPMKFARQHFLRDKKLGFFGLVNNVGKVWGSEVKRCKDGRFQICGGWASFCEANNLEVGDRCKFKKLPDTEDDILLDLVGVFKDGKKSAGGRIRASSEVKEEQCEIEEVYEIPVIDLETPFSYFAGNSTIEKGQGSRK